MSKFLRYKTKATKIAIFISGLILGLAKHVVVLAVVSTISNIAVVPDLDISLFTHYNINADITENPTSVELEISGINQDGGDIWNYYVDGSSYSEPITKTMTDANSDGNWISPNIYPDSIYPEIFFAPSSITWYNTPSNIDVRRANYHLFHFDNPLTMEGSSTFFIEFNAWPRSANSANLDVYLVKKDTNLTFFNSDWRNSANVELVDTISRNASYNHTHVADVSSHHLVALSANGDGTIGSNSLDINGDFWIVLYVNSPNTNRGWDLKYHSSVICNNTASWYIGNQSSWSTTAQSGCPDAHIHMAEEAHLLME